MYYNFQQHLSEHVCIAKNSTNVRFSLRIHGLICPFCHETMAVTDQQLEDCITDHTARHTEPV